MAASTDGEPVYFGRMRPGDALSDPSWVLRRVTARGRTVDEILGRDGEWHPSDMLARAERGELPGRLEELGPLLPAALAKVAQRQFRAVRRALARQAAGEFVLRLALPGTGTAYRGLDSEARDETAAFLTGAPLVAVTGQGVFRTDGMWVWPESIARQVVETGDPPEDEFFYHIQARAFFFPAELAPGVAERARALLEVAAAGGHTERVREANVPGRPPPPTREERQRALGAWHAEWERKHAATTPYHPERHPDDPAYHEHHVTVEASPEADWEYTVRAREIMGLDPETGQRVDI